MRYASNHKSETKGRIVRSAAKLFAEKGFVATSIDAIMRDCNLTRGGFYAHFRSKSQLYRCAIELAAAPIALPSNRCSQHEADWIEQVLNEYLSGDQENGLGAAAPLTFLAIDVASEDKDVRNGYASAFKTVSAQIATRIAAYSACSEAAIVSIAVMIVGAKAIARTVDDAPLKEKLWASCRENARALLENRSSASLSFFWEAPPDREYLYRRTLRQ
jgi:AcrR family transcriptional regulator